MQYTTKKHLKKPEISDAVAISDFNYNSDLLDALLPAQASGQNELADKNFVNSSIATNTAHYISNNGQPFESLAELEAYTGTITNNDYAFVVGEDEQGNTTYTRYKYNADEEEWAEEYVLNNSSFTAEQWASIQSGITAALVQQISDNASAIGAIPKALRLVAKSDRVRNGTAGEFTFSLTAGKCYLMALCGDYGASSGSVCQNNTVSELYFAVAGMNNSFTTMVHPSTTWSADVLASVRDNTLTVKDWQYYTDISEKTKQPGERHIAIFEVLTEA